MKLYLAGPMTGYPDFNFPLFHAEAARLRALGHHVTNPAEINGPAAVDSGITWADCMRNDIAELLKCEAIATLPGWEKSKGASLEVHIGRTLGMPIFAALAAEPAEAFQAC